MSLYLETIFAAFLRRLDGSLAVLTFSSGLKPGSDIRHNKYELIDGIDMQTVLGELSWCYLETCADEIRWDYRETDDTEEFDSLYLPAMPAWFKPPSDNAARKLIDAYAKTKTPIPITNNITTFVVYDKLNRLMGQLRSYVSPAGTPIGNPGMPSMHGGQVDNADFKGVTDIVLATPEDADNARKVATAREEWEEFGVNIPPEESILLGSVYDADARRFNYVHRVTINYDDALVRGFLAALPDTVPLEAREALGEIVRETVINKILYGEGVGRFGLDRPNLDRAIELKALTPISLAILEAFPELKPEPAKA